MWPTPLRNGKIHRDPLVASLGTTANPEALKRRFIAPPPPHAPTPPPSPFLAACAPPTAPCRAVPRRMGTPHSNDRLPHKIVIWSGASPSTPSYPTLPTLPPISTPLPDKYPLCAHLSSGPATQSMGPDGTITRSSLMGVFHWRSSVLRQGARCGRKKGAVGVLEGAWLGRTKQVKTCKTKPFRRGRACSRPVPTVVGWL
jgi:hypothetical protein